MWSVPVRIYSPVHNQWLGYMYFSSARTLYAHNWAYDRSDIEKNPICLLYFKQPDLF